MKITALDHVQLAMPQGEEQAAIDFFSGLVGFVQEEKPPALAGRGGCWFSSGGCKLHLGVEDDFRSQGKAHPAFLCEQIDVLASELECAGYPVRWDEAVAGRKRFYTADPFGNRLEFMADGDGFSQR